MLCDIRIFGVVPAVIGLLGYEEAAGLASEGQSPQADHATHAELLAALKCLSYGSSVLLHEIGSELR